jgi:hypothetical protein
VAAEYSEDTVARSQPKSAIYELIKADIKYVCPGLERKNARNATAVITQP